MGLRPYSLIQLSKCRVHPATQGGSAATELLATTVEPPDALLLSKVPTPTHFQNRLARGTDEVSMIVHPARRYGRAKKHKETVANFDYYELACHNGVIRGKKWPRTGSGKVEKSNGESSHW